MEDIRHKLKNYISGALLGLGINNQEAFAIERPGDMAHGDFSANVAMVLAKKIGENPKTLAEKIKAELDKNLPNEIAKIEVAGPGFINFYLNISFFENLIAVFNNKNLNITSNIHAGKKILVEHSSPNLFKPFHIGHMMNNTVGEAIARLAAASGAKVQTVSFPSDISLGVAKAIWQILKTDSQSFLDEPKSLEDKIKFLGEAYVLGVKHYDQDESIHTLVNEIASNLYNQKNSPELDLFEKCKKINIQYFEDVVGKLGSHFDSYIYESEAGVDGKHIVLANTPGVFTESQGAIVYIPDESNKSINTAVFINSAGNPTYEAKDIGLIDLKFKRYNPDISITITDVQQTGHFNTVLDAAGKINPDWSRKSVHRTHGRMSFKGQKMSSRLGGVPLVTEIVNTVVDEVLGRDGSRVSNGDASAVAVGAIKFAILKNMAGKNINFDPDTSLSFEGDSGPYLQYTVVRIASVLNKAAEKNLTASNKIPEGWHITNLEKCLVHFNEMLERSIVGWAPHHLTLYLIELAQYFNAFYANTRIIDGGNANEQYALALTNATHNILVKGLDILAIPVPSKM